MIQFIIFKCSFEIYFDRADSGRSNLSGSFGKTRLVAVGAAVLAVVGCAARFDDY